MYKVCCDPIIEPEKMCFAGVIIDENGCQSCAGICTTTIFHWPNNFDNKSLCDNYCETWKNEWSSWCQTTSNCDYEKGFKCEMYGPCDYQVCRGGRFACTPFYYDSKELRWKNYNSGETGCL